MANLLQCCACARHVRTNETSCPFCAAPISDASRKMAADCAAIDRAASGSSRSKRYALRAALLAGAATLAGGCGSATTNSNNGGDGNDQVLVKKDDTDADAEKKEQERRAQELENDRARHRSGGDGDLQPMPYGCVWPDDVDAVEV